MPFVRESVQFVSQVLPTVVTLFLHNVTSSATSHVVIELGGDMTFVDFVNILNKINMKII